LKNTDRASKQAHLVTITIFNNFINLEKYKKCEAIPVAGSGGL
jgi:hypothetical protein